MNTVVQPKLVTPKMERPNPANRVRTDVRAGQDGGVTHTDNWREIRRR